MGARKRAVERGEVEVGPGRREELRGKLKAVAHHRAELEWLVPEVDRLRAEVSGLEEAISEGKPGPGIPPTSRRRPV